MHPRRRRCSSLKYSRYSRSSRLASEAPRPSRCDARLSPRAASRQSNSAAATLRETARKSRRARLPRSRRCAPRTRRRPSVALATPSDPTPLNSCIRNQMPRKKIAGELDDVQEHDEEHHRQDAGVRVEHEVRPHHAGDCAAGPDHRNRPRTGSRTPGPRGPPPTRGRNQIPAVADAVLDVVAEDPQIPHVPEEVQQAAVQEHAGDEWPPSRR